MRNFAFDTPIETRGEFRNDLVKSLAPRCCLLLTIGAHLLQASAAVDLDSGLVATALEKICPVLWRSVKLRLKPVLNPAEEKLVQRYTAFLAGFVNPFYGLSYDGTVAEILASPEFSDAAFTSATQLLEKKSAT